MEYKLKDIWETEQEILDIIDSICKENNLRYSLAYGSLLGAVRHGGFIPWDDDVDIIMPADDYRKLFTIWRTVSPKGYLFQNKFTNRDINQNFSKVRKEHTTFIQYEYEKKVSYHTGIFVDIFPGYYVPKNRISRTIQKAACAVNLLMAREFRSGTNGIIGLIERVLLLLPDSSKYALYKGTENFIQSWKKSNSCGVFFPSTIGEVKKCYSVDLFDDMTTITFNGKEYMCISKYKQMLKYDYGDYMMLPPEKERVLKHHPLIVDTERSYAEMRK